MSETRKPANRRRMDELKLGLDLGAVAEALAAGEITERQAKNATKFINQVKAVREKPLKARLIQSDSGQFLGEAHPLDCGAWKAYRYGPEFRDGGKVFPSLEDAKQFIING
ncbi:MULTISPECIES: hypothetical protein [Pseudomonadota]|uniref:hypothetical protein n=1 Tax=Pseudomonadota TaxID=1224 RepID=UPI0011B25977|nr:MULTISPECIES: hypothetical protein [Pseudomonadota]MBG4275006.1 hypothetical protein [Pseudomonas aeruginosa]MBU9185076.1 hypothetical protein [Burkholderia multivorans]QYE79546.1 hypothetical protein KZ795_11910 [Pseudomonas aeruginosa]HDK6043141.1 hypothetical protein [Klebsiella pneumoniae]